MAFKMKGHKKVLKSMKGEIPGIKGFKDNSPADGRATSSPFQMNSPLKGWAEAVRYQRSIGGPSMNDLIAQRNEVDAGSDEWKRIQNQINLAYGGGDETKYQQHDVPPVDDTAEGGQATADTDETTIDTGIDTGAEDENIETEDMPAAEEEDVEAEAAYTPSEEEQEVMDKFSKKIQIAELQDRPRKAARLKRRQLRKLEKAADKASVQAAKRERRKEVEALRDEGASRREIRRAKRKLRKQIVKPAKREARKTTTWTEDML